MAYSSKPKIAEDDPRWNPKTMGNKRGAKKAYYATPDQRDRNRAYSARELGIKPYRGKRDLPVQPVWRGKRAPGGAIPNAPVRKAPNRYA